MGRIEGKEFSRDGFILKGKCLKHLLTFENSGLRADVSEKMRTAGSVCD